MTATPVPSVPSVPSERVAREGLPNLASVVADLWEQATGRSVLGSGHYAAEWLDDACRRHPPSEVGAAVLRARRTFDGAIPDAAQMVAAMRPLLDPLPDRRRAEASESEAARLAASRRRTEATLARIRREPDGTTPEEAERIAWEYIAAEAARGRGRGASRVAPEPEP